MEHGDFTESWKDVSKDEIIRKYWYVIKYFSDNQWPLSMNFMIEMIPIVREE